MTKMISCCGLVCSECPTYLATQSNDDGSRAKVAEEWTRMYGAKFSPEDINCDGCLSETGRLFGYCTQCAIRACARGKGFANCAACPDFGCEHLEAVLKHVPDARARLEALRP